MGFDFLNRKQIMFQNFFILLYIKGPKRTGKSCQTSLVAGICIFLELASFIIVMASFKNPLLKYSLGLLICTLISEKQGLEKLRSASNLRKISGPANLDFFLGLHLEKKARFIP